jgi:hypothetical protein
MDASQPGPQEIIMSLKTKFVSGLLSLTIVAGAMAGTVGQSEAKKLSKGEIAAIAGVGGFVLGLGIANANRGPDYYGYHRSSWERHVGRCYARYQTYDHRSDTYIGFDGYPHRCRL